MDEGACWGRSTSFWRIVLLLWKWSSISEVINGILDAESLNPLGLKPQRTEEPCLRHLSRKQEAGWRPRILGDSAALRWWGRQGHSNTTPPSFWLNGLLLGNLGVPYNPWKDFLLSWKWWNNWNWERPSVTRIWHENSCYESWSSKQCSHLLGHSYSLTNPSE
jgi:hypothetical protein